MSTVTDYSEEKKYIYIYKSMIGDQDGITN